MASSEVDERGDIVLTNILCLGSGNRVPKV